MFEGFERRTVDVGDGILVACVLGGEGPPVLLLHGFPQTHAMWARIAPHIVEAGYSVVCADLRGYGDSSKPRRLPDNSNYSFRAFAEDQLRLMRALGCERFHVIGHDRGGRTAHRMALDHPDAVASLAVLDIVPTYAMFMETNRQVAGAYWHWYFLSQPEPLPERMIGADPDFFYETCLAGLGVTGLKDFDPAQLDAYRRAWRDPTMIHGSCSDYRAAATIDLDHDAADLDRKVEAPLLAFYGAHGLMAMLFDIPSEWRRRAANVRGASLPGGHFFPDFLPQETAEVLVRFLGEAAAAL
ncbi:alpha/beta hydrolase [Roseiarcus sp.]|uniref:alpha/beta hydrolase n=1 Tax=Roseiarcus sp. TaxID=1969460 RepID=UPI003F945544